MDELEFKCKVITPVFMTGYDQKQPEFRSSSIKGLLRYWWRAMNAHLSLKHLRGYESRIFGGTDEKYGRSNIIIDVLPFEFESVKEAMLPHRENGRSRVDRDVIPVGTEFTVKLILLRELKLKKLILMDSDKLKSLFFLLCTLGGFGKRSRRGMGSICVTSFKMNDQLDQSCPMSVNLQTILDLMRKVSIGLTTSDEDFEYKSDQSRIYLPSSHKTRLKMPYIQEITLGKPVEREAFLKKLGKTTSSFLHDNRNTYRNALGNSKPRFASPVMVSLISNKENHLLPIVTRLNTLPPQQSADEDKQKERKGLQDIFIAEILSKS